MKKMGLTTKLLLTILLVTLSVMAAYTVTEFQFTSKRIHQRAVEKQVEAAENLVPVLATGLWTYNNLTLDTALSGLIQHDGILRVYLQDSYGEISIGYEKTKESYKKLSSEEITKAVSRHTSSSFYEYAPQQHRLSLEINKLSDKKKLGLFIVEFTLPDTLTAREAMLQRFLLWSFLLTFSILVFVFLVLQKIVINPLKKIAHASAQLANGRFLELPASQGHDELAVLTNGFNSMIKGLKENVQTRVQLEKIEASLKLTQMFAHDVRKPFSLFNIMLQAMKSSNNPEQTKKMLEKFKPELDKALHSVNCMISDILEMESQKEIKKEDVSLVDITHSVLARVFKIHKDADINIESEMIHTPMILGEKERMTRVIENLLENAIQAMKGVGILRVLSHDTIENGERYVKLSIWNSNSYIDPEDAEKIFEAFYTKGKKKGTGLGLAIAKKVLVDYGGSIKCRPGFDGVAFELLLPISINKEIAGERLLYHHSSKYSESSSVWTKPVSTSDSKKIELIQKEIKQKLATKNQSFRLLMVEDESTYIEAIDSYLQSFTEIVDLVEFSCANSFYRAKELLDKNQYDLTILDIDLGSESPDGFKVLKHKNENSPHGLSCIHSNQVNSDIFRLAAKQGADAILPKPITALHLLKLMNQAISEDTNEDSDKKGRENA
jgi:signal transduction histidine kinase